MSQTQVNSTVSQEHANGLKSQLAMQAKQSYVSCRLDGPLHF